MRCPFAEWIPSPNFTQGFAQPVITRLQHTTVGTWDASLATLTRPNGAASVSAHFLLGLDGRLAQLVDTANRAWHARGANEFAWGIEHVDDRAYWDAVRTPEQYAMSARLNRWLGEIGDLPNNADTIERHNVYVNTACPDALDVERIIRETIGGSDVTFRDDPDAQAFVTDVRNFIDAVGKRLGIDAHHTHKKFGQVVQIPETMTGEPVESMAMRKAMILPKSKTAKTKRPTAAQVRAGHGKGK